MGTELYTDIKLAFFSEDILFYGIIVEQSGSEVWEKPLEKQRVQNRLASYEVHIGHIFYNVNATVSFGNCLTLSIFRFQIFLPDRQTETDKTDCLTPSRMRVQGKKYSQVVGLACGGHACVN